LSEAAVIAVVSVIATVLVAVAGHIKDYVVRRQDIEARERERKDDATEWYRRSLFEKRLAALEEAQFLLNKLAELRGGGASRQDDLFETVRKGNDWLGRNSIYLVGEGATKSKLYDVLYWAIGNGSRDEYDAFQNAVKETVSQLKELADELLLLKEPM
jgi:hypothetical protein